MMEINVKNLQNILPTNQDITQWALLLNKYLPTVGIVSAQQISRFLAQTAHESSDYNILVENLNYSATGLLTTFPKYFNTSTAAEYARKPERIANRVYANRMNNGPESSGDGWNFRGSGIIQITGRTNYANCSIYIFSDSRLLTNPELLREPEFALRSALWFWSVNNLNDISDMTLLTRKINGGSNGLGDRIARYDHAMSILEKDE